jgi:hypothetical protein
MLPIDVNASRIPERVSRLLRWVAALFLAAALVMALLEYLRLLDLESDTFAMVAEVDRMIAAFRVGNPSGWAAQFPLLQQIPATFLKLLGLSDAAVVRWLAVLSLAAFAGLLLHAWTIRRESRQAACLLAVVLVSGPLLWYARSSFGEMLAAFFTLSFAARCRERSPGARILVDGILAGISKETAFPFLLILGCTASFGDAERWKNREFVSSRIRIIAIAVLVAVAANATFNQLRFGTVLNVTLMNPLFRVSSLSDQASFFLGHWLSPNGGVLLFWPSYGLLFALAAVAGARSYRRASGRAGRLAAVLPLAGVSLASLGLTLGLSRWAFPIGWICWGPRFFVPWVPAFAYVLVTAYSRPMEELLARLGRPRWKAWTLASALALSSAPQFAVLFKTGILDELARPDAEFPKVGVIQEDRDYYLRATHHGLWRKRSILQYGYGARPPLPALLTLACCLAVAYLWTSTAREYRRDSVLASGRHLE